MNATNPARIFGALAVAGIAAQLCLASGALGATNEQREESWRAAIAHTPTPSKGCFTAAYPLTVWKQVSCVTAPERPYIPATGTRAGGQTVGDGNDYAAVTATLPLQAAPVAICRIASPLYLLGLVALSPA